MIKIQVEYKCRNRQGIYGKSKDTTETIKILWSDGRLKGTYSLVGFSYKVKQIKAKGQVVEEYMVVQATKVFTNEKDPEEMFTVSYERGI